MKKPSYIILIFILLFLNLYFFVLQKNIEKLNFFNLIVSNISIFLSVILLNTDNINKNFTEQQYKLLSAIYFYINPYLILCFILNESQLLSSFNFFIFNYFIIFSLQMMFYLFFNNKITSIILISTLILFIFILNEHVFISRNKPIMVTDIFSIKTALSVSAKYKFKLNSNMVRAISFTIFNIAFSFKFFKKTPKKKPFKTLILLSSSLLFLIFNPFKVEGTLDPFDYRGNISSYGTLYYFYDGFKKINFDKPENYSKEKTELFFNNYSKKNSNTTSDYQQPNIIVIMNEAFSDLELVGNNSLSTNKEYLSYFNSLKRDKNTISGIMYSSVFGGYTCNTEFEFLTRLPTAFFPKDSLPYMQFINKKIDSFPSYLSNQKYTNTAIHPFWGVCWNRNTIYPFLSFDNFIDAEKFNNLKIKNPQNEEINWRSSYDFGDLDYVRGYISDLESYKKIIQNFKSTESPKFIFNVTMQNHGGYNYRKDDFKNDIIDENIDSFELSQYLSLINESDKAFEFLINYFETETSPTVVLLFGDHQPGLGDAVYSNFIDTSDNSIKNMQEKYKVPYIIWANFELKRPNNVQETSPNYLSTILKDACNMPLDSIDIFLNELRKEYPVITSNGIKDKNNNWLDLKNANDEMLTNYEHYTYYSIKTQNRLIQ